LIVVIVDDMPLREQIAAGLAAGFGSQVRMESQIPAQGGILVCGGQFWLDHSRALPLPSALLVATLPIPSREDPRVAAQIEWYKHQHRDWFREYLWPECLRRLALITAPLRGHSTILAFFDTRIVCRSYGQDVLHLLSPYEWVELSQAPAFNPWLDKLQLDAP
jgi:ATP-dependent DNA helicase DinG